MNLCTPLMTTIFWIVIVFTVIAGLWFIWRKNVLEDQYNKYIDNATNELIELRKKDEKEIAFIRESYDIARKGYLDMMKEMKSDEIPDPVNGYLPKR